MIGPDQDLSQFPPWIWPYIRVADLARSQVFAAGKQSAVEQVPEAALLGHFVAIVQAVQLKSIAGHLGAAGADLAKAAGQAVAEEIDDWCGTKGQHPPLPHPHRAAELATHLAVFAASSTNERLRGELPDRPAPRRARYRGATDRGARRARSLSELSVTAPRLRAGGARSRRGRL